VSPLREKNSIGSMFEGYITILIKSFYDTITFSFFAAFLSRLEKKVQVGKGN
jgi:hypothetical protein